MTDMYLYMIDAEIDLMVRAVKKFDWENKEKYGRYLKQTHTFVTHSVLLLANSAKLVTDENIKKDLEHHIAEEKGHEKLAERDLKTLGYDLETFEAMPESMAMYQRIYKESEEVDPIAPLMGYAVALEGLSAKVALEITQRVEKAHGKGSASFIKLHGEVDQDHSKESVEGLKKLTQKQRELVMESIKKTREDYLNLMNLVFDSKEKAIA